jgi:hypothetical protein
MVEYLTADHKIDGLNPVITWQGGENNPNPTFVVLNSCLWSGEHPCFSSKEQCH